MLCWPFMHLLAQASTVDLGSARLAFYAPLSPGSARLLKGVSDLVHHTETPGMGPSDAM